MRIKLQGGGEDEEGHKIRGREKRQGRIMRLPPTYAGCHEEGSQTADEGGAGVHEGSSKKIYSERIDSEKE